MTDLAIPVFPAAYPSKPSRPIRSSVGVLDARWSSSPLRGIKNPGTGSAAQRAGKRYERKVLKALEKQVCNNEGIMLRVSPWIGYTVFSTSINDEKHCQPDLLLETPNEVYICEVKLTHTVDAYWQLTSLYAPVVRKLYPGRSIRLVEITRSFDPVVRFPSEMRLFFSIEHILRTPATEAVEVLQWKL